MTRFAFFFLLAAVSAPASADDLSRYAGKYIGCAVSSGEWVPIATTLTASAEGLNGSYIFIENGQWIPGRLSFSQRDSDARLSFGWTDVYGAGGAIFDFSSDANRFDGFWTSDDGNSFPWNGVRQGSGLPNPDCRTPVA